jgi:hypothetical protein
MKNKTKSVEEELLPEDEIVENVPAVSSIDEDKVELTMPDIIPKKPLTVLERYVCELYASGHNPKAISVKIGMPVQSIRSLLAKPYVREFVSELIQAQYNVIKEGRLRILNKIVEDKLEEIEEQHDGNLAKATKKDVVDLLLAMDSMLKEREKAELGTSDDTYINIIQQVLKD